MKAWAVIMAGGSGTRFWPVSRRSLPKQYLALFGKKTLLEQTFDRLLKVVPREQILVFVSKDKVALTRKLLRLPAKRVIGEPVGRNTAPCVAWATSIILKEDPSAVIGVFPADHYIREERSFRIAVKTAYQAAAREGMPVTLGIKPDAPHTGYGYLEVGEAVERLIISRKATEIATGTERPRNDVPTEIAKSAVIARRPKADEAIANFPNVAPASQVFYLKRFCEKPDARTAEKYVRSGKFLWNAGIFVWRADCLLETVRKYQPEIFKITTVIANENPGAARVASLFKKSPSISIDYGLMEKIPGEILTIPVSMGWNDVGGWASLHKLLSASSDRNVISGKSLLVESTGNYVKSSGKLIAAIGLKDHAVIETDDAILVCPMSKTEEIRKIVAALKTKKMKRYL